MPSEHLECAEDGIGCNTQFRSCGYTRSLCSTCSQSHSHVCAFGTQTVCKLLVNGLVCKSVPAFTLPMQLSSHFIVRFFLHLSVSGGVCITVFTEPTVTLDLFDSDV